MELWKWKCIDCGRFNIYLLVIWNIF